MGNKVKFHLDENVSYSIALGLRQRGLDITTTPEVKTCLLILEQKDY